MTKRRLPRIARSIRLTLSILLITIVLIPALLVALAATEAGSRWFLEQAAPLLVPEGAELSVTHRSGHFLEEIAVDDVRFRMGELAFTATQLGLAWRPSRLLQGALDIVSISANGPHLEIPEASPPETPTAPQLPDIELPIAVTVRELKIDGLEVIQGEARQRIDVLTMSASADARGIQIYNLELTQPDVRLHGEARFSSTTPHTLNARLTIALGAGLTDPSIGPIDANVDITGPALRPRFAAVIAEPMPLRVNGALLIDRVTPAFELEATWPQLAWPPIGETLVVAREGRLALAGDTSRYRFELTTDVQADRVPSVNVTATGEGDARGLSLAPMELAQVDTQAQITGTLAWADAPAWSLNIEARSLDPGVYVADWPGHIDGRLQLNGRIDAGAPTFELQIEQLEGRLRGFPVTANGRLEYRQQILRTDGLRLTSGKNQLRLNGELGERLGLAIEVDAEDLSQVYPELSGRLEGAAELGGTRNTPTLDGDFDAREIGLKDLASERLTLAVDWGAAGGTGRVEIDGLTQGDLQVDRVNASVTGTPERHRADLFVQSPTDRLAIELIGGLSGDVWQGQVADLRVGSDLLGEWRLAGPASLGIGKNDLHSGALCLEQAPARLCTQGRVQYGGTLNLAVELTDLMLEQFAPHLPFAAELDGALSGELRLTGALGRPSARLILTPSNGELRLMDTDEPISIAFRDARVDGRFEDDRGEATLRLDLGGNGRAEGLITVGPETAGQRALGGAVDAAFPDLSLLSGFVPDLAAFTGALQLSASLAGTLDAPRFTGQARVDEASAEIPAAGIRLEEVTLSAQGDGSGPIQLSGRARSGNGRLELAGVIDLASGGPGLDLQLKGEDFQAARLPEALVTVSPDLAMRGDRPPYELTGTVKIPTATFEIAELPAGTVSVSDDEIIVGETAEETPLPRSEPLLVKVVITLGDAVRFDGFGLTTRLTGTLNTTLDQTGPSVDGKVELVDGRYKAYGQDLTIEQGRLLFAGPAGNPGLDLRAVRESRDGNVRAFLEMSGPLRNPRPRIYSEPSLPEAEALAYLLTGKGLSGADRSEGIDIAGAALSLGIGKGEPLMQDLGERFGLDELEIETGDEGLQGSSLILGKYLDPNLYLGYTQGLFDPAGAVLLRWRLTDQIELESRSGTEQSVDLYYRIEHD